MDLINPDLERYLGQTAAFPHPVLDEMHERAQRERFPIVGPQVGRLLFVLARTQGARRILELGSGFGYSAFWFARGMADGGRVILTDFSAERTAQAQDYLGRAGLGERIECHTGDALAVGRAQTGPFDIVFNDIDKDRYPESLDIARTLLRPGGLFISDNMIWSGRVIEPDSAEGSTRGVVELTRRLYASDDFLPALLPVRDGVIVAVRL